MKDKDLLVVIAEMLRKQDQHTEILDGINKNLTGFMDISIKQFEQQQVFNECFLDSFNRMAELNEKVVDRSDKNRKKF